MVESLRVVPPTIRRTTVAALFACVPLIADAAPGDLDSSFGTGGKVLTSFGTAYDSVAGVVVQPDGRIVVAGTATITSTSDFALARYKPNGSVDTGFGNGGTGKVTTDIWGGGSDTAAGIVLQTDGKIVVAGSGVVLGTQQFAVARYEANGTPDYGFGSSGVANTAMGTAGATGNAVALQPDGKIVVAGTATSGGYPSFAIARFTTAGALDSTFGSGGKAFTTINFSTDGAFAVAIQPDGKIVAAGYSQSGSVQYLALVRYNTNGTLDTTFDSTGKVTTAISANSDLLYAVAIQPDGKIVVAGTAQPIGSSSTDALIARYDANGSLDTAGFNAPLGYLNAATGTSGDGARAIALQTDGKIVVAGYSLGANFHNVTTVMRLNANGTLDATFGTGGKALHDLATYNDSAQAIAFQNDGRIVVAGSSDADTGGGADFLVARLIGPDATPDAFAFTAQAGVAQSATTTSNAITVSGLEVPARIAVANGSYSIGCTATFVTSAALISNGQSVCVRHTSASGFFAQVTTALTIGATNGTFTSTTLYPPTATLTVARAGTGIGSVSSSLAGIQCGNDCSETYAGGTSVTLTATSSPGSSFAGWSGACAGANPCALTMSGPLTVTATFTLDSAPPAVGGPLTRSAGLDHNLVVTPAGEVWGWGGNTAGKLGNAAIANSAIPVRAAGLAGMVAVGTGMSHSLAVKSDGKVYAWGLSNNGQLGVTAPSTCTIPDSFGTPPCAKTPVEVTGMTGALAVGGGWGHSIALKNDQTVWRWGDDFHGGSSATPVPVPGVAGATKIAVGYFHTAVLLSNGTVMTWGRFAWGELGREGAADVPAVVPGLTGITDISSSGSFTLALRNDGTVWAWGFGRYGAIGDGFTSDTNNSPVQVPGLSNVVEIAAGYGHALVRKGDGTVWGWGLNHKGQLGITTTELCGQSLNLSCARSPAQLPAHTGAAALAAGGAHSMVIHPGGTMALFGTNISGQLGTTAGDYGTQQFTNTIYDPDFSVTPGGTFGSGGSTGTGSSSGGLNLGTVDSGVRFAPQLAGTPSSATAVALTNLTDTPIGITAISTTGEFASSHDCGASLAANAGCTINITFTPSGAGARSGTINIASDMPDSPTVSLALSGSGATVPGAPTIGAAAAGNAQASVSFTPPPSDGGSPITSYQATSSPGGVMASGSASPVAVPGLVNGVAYTFTVTAINAFGAGSPSANSNSVTPTAPALLSVSLAGTGVGTVTGTGINCGADCTETFPIGTQVTLSAAAAGGSTFAGWSGSGCSGTGTCQVTMNGPVTVTATFNLATTTPPRSGFNGDARSDVFWRDTTNGLNYQWQMNGLAISGQGYMPTVPANWTVAGIGDVGGDGIADVFWREAGGLNYLWTMNGLAIASQGYLPTVPNPWTVAGLGDASGDGQSDVFWRNPTSGDNYLWVMNGLSITSQGYLPNVPGPDWEIVGVADYTGDAKVDVLWRNKATGANYLWAMNGLVVSSQGYLPTVTPVDWEVVGNPDANADGKADVLWRNKVTGQNYLWLMNGFAISSQGYLPSVADPNWKVFGYGDYNGDGRGDVLWRNATTGQNYLWTLNGISVATQGYLSSVTGANWAPIKR